MLKIFFLDSLDSGSYSLNIVLKLSSLYNYYSHLLYILKMFFTHQNFYISKTELILFVNKKQNEK